MSALPNLPTPTTPKRRTHITAVSPVVTIPATPCECAMAITVSQSLNSLWAAANDAAFAADKRTNDPAQKLYIAQMLETVQYLAARTPDDNAKAAMIETLTAAFERIGA